MEFQDRVREAIRASGKTQAQVAKEVGVSQSAIAQWLSGNVKSLKAETADALEIATGYRARWLITGKGVERVDISDMPVASTKAVALLRWNQPGVTRTYAEMSNASAADWVACPVPHGPDTFALRVRGSSMYNPVSAPSFAEEDLIYADPSRPIAHGSFVVVRDPRATEASFRQLLIEGSAHHLQALNPSWPDRISILADPSHICGVVIARLTIFDPIP